MANDRRSGEERRFFVHQYGGPERRRGTDRRTSKICPFCSVNLALAATVCFSCKRQVGKAGKYGMAEKPIAYWSYVACFLSWTGLYLYIRWAFL